MEQVIVYSTPTCVHCNAAKAFLKENNVEFVEKDVTQDQEARAFLISKGYRGVPVIQVGEVEIQGFDQPRLSELLGL